MASVTRADFEKSVLRIEERLAQIEQNAGAQQIASDATLQSFQKEMANYVDDVVHQAKTAFTTSELQARAQQDLTQGVISSAKGEFQHMKWSFLHSGSEHLHDVSVTTGVDWRGWWVSGVGDDVTGDFN